MKSVCLADELCFLQKSIISKPIILLAWGIGRNRTRLCSPQKIYPPIFFKPLASSLACTVFSDVDGMICEVDAVIAGADAAPGIRSTK